MSELVKDDSELDCYRAHQLTIDVMSIAVIIFRLGTPAAFEI
jgi:hypothetical protein